MNEYFVTIFNYITDFINFAFAEVSIVGFILGLILFLLGAVIIFAITHTALTGKRVSGKVVGAVKDIRIQEKERDGKIEKEQKETLFAIFEYTRPNGSLRQEKSSSGGSNVLKYKTGQTVNLVITPYGEYDDVYDVNDHSTLIMAIIFIVIGFGIMFWAGSFYVSLGAGALTLVSIVGGFIFKLLISRKKNKKTSGKYKHIKEFDPADIRPIEDFIRENEQA